MYHITIVLMPMCFLLNERDIVCVYLFERLLWIWVSSVYNHILNYPTLEHVIFVCGAPSQFHYSRQQAHSVASTQANYQCKTCTCRFIFISVGDFRIVPLEVFVVNVALSVVFVSGCMSSLLYLLLCLCPDVCLVCFICCCLCQDVCLVCFYCLWLFDFCWWGCFQSPLWLSG